MRSGGGAGSMTSVPGTLAELGYDLPQRALDQQERVLGDLRTRTGTLLTATALVATFLGGRVLDSGTNKVLALTGAAFAIGCIVLCVLALAPRMLVAATTLWSLGLALD
jgi:hypothetical protein